MFSYRAQQLTEWFDEYENDTKVFYSRKIRLENLNERVVFRLNCLDSPQKVNVTTVQCRGNVPVAH